MISTLAIAALLTPLRRRIQDMIDRRFYRQKYDARMVMDQFTGAARLVTDCQALIDQLAAVFQETTQLEHARTWINLPAKHRKKVVPDDLTPPNRRAAK